MKLRMFLTLAVAVCLALLPGEVPAQGTDTDGDGMPDDYELANWCLDWTVPDAEVDFDGDELNNISEYLVETNPCSWDTDTDGFDDCEDIGERWVDGHVNVLDVHRVAKAGLVPGSPEWQNLFYDIIPNGTVNILDVVMEARIAFMWCPGPLAD